MKHLIPVRVVAESTCAHLCGRDEFLGDTFFVVSCDAYFLYDRLVVFAVYNYSLPLVHLICLNRLAAVLESTTWQLIVLSWKYLSFWQYKLYVFSPIFVFFFFIFASLLISLNANDICKHPNLILDEHFLPKIANDICKHLNSRVVEHSRPMLTDREWLMQEPGV